MALIPGTLPSGTKYPNDPQALLDTFAGYLTAPSSGAISKTVVNAKGDILAATGNDVVTRLGVGIDGSVLTADSSEATGLKWDTVLNSAAINNLTELSATPDASDKLVIDDAGVVKKITVSNLANATLGITGTKNVADGVNLALNTGNGTKIGTSNVQKLGFWNATPVPQPTVSADLLDSLQSIGLIASGAGNTPLDLTDGSLSCGAVSCGTITLDDAANIVPTAVAGTKLGTATSQKIGFWNADPVDQPALTADLLDSLQEVGLIASGAGNTPLNLSGGAVQCGTITCDTITLNDAANIAFNISTGTKIGTATTQKLAFYNATPIAQPAAAAQAAAAAQTQDSVTDNTGGAASTTLAAIAAPAANATSSLTSDMTAVRNALASIAAQLAKIRTDVANMKTLQDAERTALVNLGLIKGAA